jgi:hypothetical protein
MPYRERNKILMKMLEGHNNIIVFPSPWVQSIDGLPQINILCDGLKEVANRGVPK